MFARTTKRKAVVEKSDGELYNKKARVTAKNSFQTTPKCVLCDVYPSTAYGFAKHLGKNHNSTLGANEIYLLCSCGIEVRSETYNPNHVECDGKQFTLHTLDTSHSSHDDLKKTEPILREIGVEEDKGSAESVEEEQEDEEEYKKGGYHRVIIGEIFNRKYKAKRKLGWGSFSTVWLCEELKKNRYVALKISRADNKANAIDEIELLQSIDKDDPRRNKIIQLLDSFNIRRVNGDHICMVFEKMDNDLFTLISRYNKKGFEINKVKYIIRQVLEGLDYLHTECKIIHTDIKPDNIFVTLKDGEIDQVKIGDLGNALPLCPDMNSLIQTEQYSSTADIWSTACMAFELATGEYLFDPKEANYTSGSDHLTMIFELLGSFTHIIYTNGSRLDEVFDENGELRPADKLNMLSLMQRLQEHKYSSNDASQFSSFLSPMLEVDHKKRATAAQSFQHQWLQSTVAAASVTEREAKPVYCTCKRAEFGKMVGCDNSECKSGEWFHFKCVGMRVGPSKHVKWYCEDCRPEFKEVPNQWYYEKNEVSKNRK